MVLLAALAGLCACAPRYAQSELAPDARLPRSSKIAVLPVVTTDAHRAAEPYRAGRIAEGAEAAVTDLLYEALAKQTLFEAAARPLVEQELGKLAAPQTSGDGLQALALALEADAVLRGVVTEYREREGSRVGVTRPAAVGIELWLIRARDGETIWHGRYYESQQSMTEELRTVPLYFKRGARWLTARELAAYAVAELFKTFPPPS